MNQTTSETHSQLLKPFSEIKDIEEEIDYSQFDYFKNIHLSCNLIKS